MAYNLWKIQIDSSQIEISTAESPFHDGWYTAESPFWGVSYPKEFYNNLLVGLGGVSYTTEPPFQGVPMIRCGVAIPRFIIHSLGDFLSYIFANLNRSRVPISNGTQRSYFMHNKTNTKKSHDTVPLNCWHLLRQHHSIQRGLNVRNLLWIRNAL